MMDLNVSDAFGVAGSVLLSLGGGGVIVVLMSGWLGRVWANRLMHHDLAKHNTELEELKSKFEAANQRIQTELDKTLVVHRVQFETEFKALSDIWARVSAVRGTLATPCPRFESEGKAERLHLLIELAIPFSAATVALRRAVHDQAPFYSKAIYEKLNEFIGLAGEAENDLRLSKDNDVALSLWFDINPKRFEKVAPLADQISDLIRQRIESLSLYRE